MDDEQLKRAKAVVGYVVKKWRDIRTGQKANDVSDLYPLILYPSNTKYIGVAEGSYMKQKSGRYLLLLTVMLALSACGGGGGNDDSAGGSSSPAVWDQSLWDTHNWQ